MGNWLTKKMLDVLEWQSYTSINDAPITFVSYCGSRISLDISHYHNINDIKARLEREVSFADFIPKERQLLIAGGQEVTSLKNLTATGEHTVYVRFRPDDTKFYIVLWDICSQRPSVIITKPEIKVQLFKRQVFSHTGIPHNKQRLIFNNRVLQDETCLGDHDIVRGSVIGVMTRPESGLRVLVRIVTGRPRHLVIDVPFDATVLDAKRVIESSYGIRPQHQRLVAWSKNLPDESTLADAGVHEGSLLMMVVRTLGDMQVFVQPIMDNVITVDTQEDQRVLQLKEVIDEKKKIAPPDQLLIFEGQRLSDNHTLRQSGIAHESLIHLVRIMRIAVRVPGRETVQIEARPITTVRQVREMIENKLESALSESDRMFCDYQCLDEGVLIDYGVHKMRDIELEIHWILLKVEDNFYLSHGMRIYAEMTDSVRDVKKKISTKIDRKLSVGDLFLDLRKLEDNRFLADYCSPDETYLKLKANIHSDARVYEAQSGSPKDDDLSEFGLISHRGKIFRGFDLPLEPTYVIEDIRGKKIEIPLRISCNASRLKEEIHAVTGIPVQNLRLWRSGIELTDSIALDTLPSGSIHMSSDEDRKMRVFVKDTESKIVPMVVDPTTTVRSLKQDVMRKLGLMIHRFDLVLDNDAKEFEES